MKNVIELITELQRDWEKAGSYSKANACDYILHRLASAEPTPDATGKVLSGIKCPKCGGKTHWRTGVGFEHERRCPECEYSFEPDSAGKVLLTKEQWETHVELNRKLGLCIGALKGVQFQCDEGLRQRIQGVLDDCESADTKGTSA